MSERPTILIVEDDAAMRAGLSDNLEIEGYRVAGAPTLREAQRAVLQSNPDLILLDIMLPDGSGIDFCRELRAQGLTLPIIMLTAKSQEMDKVVGLEMGADDYVVKPFSLRELLARVNAHLRRARSKRQLQEVVRVGVAEVDFKRHRLIRDGQVLEFSAKESDLLRFLVVHRGQVVSRDALLAEVWGHSQDVVTRTVDNFVARLRKKIEPDPARPRYLITVHGSGYKLLED
ncbi:MAG: response regulator transcription factor [Gammaproteobacteria bacterium]